jgi:hypothetical protein
MSIRLGAACLIANCPALPEPGMAYCAIHQRSLRVRVETALKTPCWCCDDKAPPMPGCELCHGRGEITSRFSGVPHQLSKPEDEA